MRKGGSGVCGGDNNGGDEDDGLVVNLLLSPVIMIWVHVYIQET